MYTQRLLIPFLTGLLLTSTLAVQAKILSGPSAGFIENKGQITDQYGKPRKDIGFRMAGNDVNLFIGNGQLHYQWTAPVLGSRPAPSPHKIGLYRLDVTLVGANTTAPVITAAATGGYEQYYTPGFGPQGGTAQGWNRITYQNVYPDIDWVLYIKDNAVEYDFVVRPCGNISDIKLKYEGATRVNIDAAGRLNVATPYGAITEQAPVSYQQDRQAVLSRFILRGNTLGFSTGDYTGTLTIDPTISWVTYFGGTGDETLRAGCVSGDMAGNTYLAGYTSSAANIATTGSHQSVLSGSADGFLVKYNSAGIRQWATYYGGTGADVALATATDAAGNVYLSGHSTSSGLATTGSYQPAISGGQDAFLVKFDSAGTRLWATYFGGTGTEQGLAVKCDRSNNVYLAGYTNSAAGIAAAGSAQPAIGGGNDAFLVKFSSSGAWQWATYFGGTSADQGWGIGCDRQNQVYLCGYTQSTTGVIAAGAHQPAHGGGQDAFLVKYDSTGARQWATYYGGSGSDQGGSVVCDGNDNVYLLGSTTSTAAMTTAGSHQAAYGGGIAGDAFLAKFSSAGVRQWATYYGGAGNETGSGIAWSATGAVYLTGTTSSTGGIATTGTFRDSLNGVSDAWLAKFDTAGTRLWGTYIGGESDENGYGVYCNDRSKIFVGGQTGSYTGLATAGSQQAVFGGGSYDGFLARFDDCLLTAPSAISGADTVCRNGTYTYTVPAVTGATAYTWTLPAGWVGSSTTNSISVQPRGMSDTIKVAANFACGISAAAIRGIKVRPRPVLTPAGTVWLCQGDSIQLHATTGLSYQWLKNGSTITSATGGTLTVSTAGRYSVAVTMAGCTDTALADTVVLRPLPVPVIAVSGSVLSTGTFAAYQWNYNGAPVTGAHSSSYTINIHTGSYSVTVTDSNGCSATSALFDAAKVAVTGTGMKTGITLYPNPSTGMVYIGGSGPVNISLSAIEGKLIRYYPQVTQLDISSLPAGMYVLRITNLKGQLVDTQKLIKGVVR